MVTELSLKPLIETGLEENAAVDILSGVNQLQSTLPPSACWVEITRKILTPDQPFALHKLLHETIFADWDVAQGPPPAWFPSKDQIQTTNLAHVMRALNLNSYEDLYAWSVQHRPEFWDFMIQGLGIRFKREFNKVVDLSDGVALPHWLVDAQLNIAESCFNAPDDAPAIVFQPEDGAFSTVTYKELRLLANRVANGLVHAGFCPGDAIAVNMPMTAESVAIYLGIVTAGCIVVSIADSFAPDEIAIRLQLGNAKAIFTQDCIVRAQKHLPLYTKVVSANAPKVIVLTGESRHPSCAIRLRDGDLTWEEFLSEDDRFDAVSCQPANHTNILFSSGTTGEPKAIPWTQTTPIKCAADGYLHQDIQPSDVVTWPTSIGWMMGPWLIYASLINQATIGLYYGVPTGRGFGEFVQNARVNMLGVVPSLVRTWKNTGCMQGLDWLAIKAYSSTGECSNPEDMLFLMSLAGYRPVIEYCGGTEIGGGYISGTMVQPAAPAAFTTPTLGLDFLILDEGGQPSDNGEVFLTSPSVGLSTTLLNRDHHEVYFEGTPKLPPDKGLPDMPLRRHGDQVERLRGNYYRIHGRVDDTMNLGGVKVSSAEIEQTLNLVDGIQETAAIAVSPPGGGPSQLVIYIVFLEDADMERVTLKSALQMVIRQHLNPLFKIHDIVIVDALPRTASNKIMRRILRNKYQD